MSYLSLVIYINEEDYSTLLSEGEIEKNGETYYYDESALYVIKDVSVPEYAETAGYASQAGSARVAERATTDASGNNIVQTYGKKPLVIEVDDTDFDTILKSGTYNSVTLAINNGRDVIIKATMTNEGDQILYFNLSIDYSEDHSTYNFYSTYLGYGLVLDNTNLLEFFSNASPNNHYHGNINSLGRISSTTTIANGDKLVITDASSNNLIKASSISFNGSTTSKALTQKGTWENVVNSINGQTGAVTLGTAASLNAGSANGVATLDSGGKVPASQLPSYVDDIVEGYYKEADGKFYSTLSGTTYSNEITAESGKIYVDLTTSKSYRWSGSSYIIINANSEPEIIIHEISSTIYPNANWGDEYNESGLNILDSTLYNTISQEIADGKEVLIKAPFYMMDTYLKPFVIYSGEFLAFSNSSYIDNLLYSFELEIHGDGNIYYYVKNLEFLTENLVNLDGVKGAIVSRFCSCTTAAATAAKTASIAQGEFTLLQGTTIYVNFINANTADNPTLNISNSGAKNILINGTLITTGDNKKALSGVVAFIYDGTAWNIISNYSENVTAGDNVTVNGNQVSVPTFPVDKVVPIYEKTYENYTCGTANTNDMYIFFGNVIPTSNNWYEPWEIYYTLKISTSNDLCLGLYDIKVSFTGTTVVYSIYNRFYSSSYYPIYSHYWLYHNTLEKYNSREDHPFKIGARVLSAYLQTSLARTYEIKVWELEGCTFNFPQNIETYTNIWNTNYWAGTTANATSLGLLETGDTDTTTTMLLYYSKVKAGINGIKRYSLIMLDGSGAWSSFTTGIGGIDPKNKNTVGFILGSPIYYVNLSGDTAPNEYIGYGAIRTRIALVDLRYSLNINVTANGLPGNLLPRLPLYIVGHLESDGLFYLEDTWWTQTEPTTEDGKIYIKVSESIYADYENARCYRTDLISDGYAYWFKDGQFLRYSLQSYSQNSVNEFIYRKTLNPTKGDYAQVTKIEGNTVTMHQMLGTGTADVGSWTLDGTTYTGTSTANNTVRLLRYSVPTIKDHKYYFSAKYKLIRDTTISGSFYCGYFGGPTLWLGSKISGETIRAGYNHKIVITSTSNHSNVQVGLYGGSSDVIAATDTLTVSDIMLVDLTRIYGAGYEPTYPEQFESDYFKRFGKPLTYEAFNNGYLRNVKMSSIKTIGFNQWDEEWLSGYWNGNKGDNVSFVSASTIVCNKNPIKVLPNTTYRFTSPTMGRPDGATGYFNVRFVDINGVILETNGNGLNNTLTSPEGAAYLYFNISAFYGNTYNNDICINISDTNKNGTYETHWSETRNIPITTLTGKVNGQAESVVVFPDGMLSAGSVHDEIYKQGSKTYAIKRVGRIDLGSMTWSFYSQGAYPSSFKAAIDTIQNAKSLIAINFSQGTTWGHYGLDYDKTYFIGTSFIYMCDLSYTTSAAFKTAMNGVYLNYELAEPIIYTDLQYADGTPFNLPITYKAEKGGTEEIIPVTGEKSTAPILNITYGGTSSQFLKADGSVDSNTYLTSQDISGKADKSNTAAGTYKSVTVNNQGIVTAGTNPTTLSGYGITDAVTLTGQQTISGLKTFSSGVKLLTASAWDNADRGIPFSDPSDTTKIVYTYTDSNKGLTYNPNTGALKVGSIVKRNGISSQFLKADGSVDSNTYINTGDTALVKSGSLSAQSFIKNGGTASQFLKADGSVDSTAYAAAGSYQMPTNPFGGSGIAIHQNVINNGFYAADKRATVTLTGFVSNGAAAISRMFDGNYESLAQIAAGNTGVILIDSGSTPLFGSYSYGWTYISFYYTYIPESISMRVYGTTSLGTLWYNLTNKGVYYPSNSNYCYRFLNTGIYDCTKWEITITAPSNHATYVTQIDHLFSRGATQYMSAITKYPITLDFYGNIEAPAFIKRGGTSLLFLKADGSVDSTAYASLISPSLTGVPSAPTAALGTNTTLIATTAFVKSEIANLASTSPEVLEALEALAEALEASGENPASAIMNAIGNVLSSIPTLVHLTLDEYDALSTAEKNNGTWYFIEEE